jgi:hypothetical protein
LAGVLTCATVVGAPATSSAQAVTEPPSALSRVFVTGATSGEPSTAKWATLYTLYGLTVASLAFSGIATFAHLDAGKATDAFLDAHRSPGPCFDLTSLTCEELERLRTDERRNGTLAAVSLAGAGVFLLSGILTAQQWINVKPELVANEEGASLNVRIQF